MVFSNDHLRILPAKVFSLCKCAMAYFSLHSIELLNLHNYSTYNKNVKVVNKISLELPEAHSINIRQYYFIGNYKIFDL